MSVLPKKTIANVPCLRYCEYASRYRMALRYVRFSRTQLVVSTENDTIAHARLTFDNRMIMLGSAEHGERDRLMKQPDEIGGAKTQTVHVIVTDDEVYSTGSGRGAV